MFHIDKIANQLRKVGSPAEVRGIADSGWFIETGKVPEQGNFRNWQVNRRGSFSYHGDKLSWEFCTGPGLRGAHPTLLIVADHVDIMIFLGV